jgi:DNA-binding MarR family transcriptional regulator
MPEALSHELHILAAKLDTAAEGLLRREAGVSYARFLALFAVRETDGSQRDMARWLSLTEPSASRMVSALVNEGLLSATRVTGQGNRRHLRLTDDGAQLVERCSDMLESRFQDLVRRSGVPLETYRRDTRRLITQLDVDQQSMSAPSVQR